MYVAGEWVAAAGEGGRVDRDWSSNVTNNHRGGSKILLVLVDVYQSMSHSPYSFYKALNEKPLAVTTSITSHPTPCA